MSLTTRIGAVRATGRSRRGRNSVLGVTEPLAHCLVSYGELVSGALA